MAQQLARAIVTSLSEAASASRNQAAIRGVGRRFEGVGAACVPLEDAHNRFRFDRVRDHRLGAVIDIRVSVRGETRRPALRDLLIHALEHFGSQVVAVVLGDGGHDVEREGTGGAGSELVVDEGEFDATLILELL